MPEIKFKRGLEASIPTLDVAEPGFTTDTEKFFIGSAVGNIQFAKQVDLDATNIRIADTINLDSVNAQLADMANNVNSYGTADDTSFFQQALTKKGKLILKPNVTYTIKSPLLIPDDIREIDGYGSKIIFQYAQIGSGYESLFYTSDRKTPLTIKNMELQYNGTFDTGSSYSGTVCGIDIRTQTGFTGLKFINVEVHGFNSAGIQIGYGGQFINDVLIENCYLHHNRVAGAWFGFVNVCNITNNRAEYNGLSTDNGTGYGFAGISSYYPKNVIIANNVCSFNYRKGIDFHSGYNGTIADNICEGNRYYGIYVVLQNDYISPIQPAGDWHIENNTISNMTLDKSVDTTAQTDMYGIHAGLANGQGNAGTIKNNMVIEGNTIINLNAINGANGYGFFLSTAGFDLANIKLANNIVDVLNVNHFVRVQEGITTGTVGTHTDLEIIGNTFRANQISDFAFKVRSAARLRQLTINGNVIELKGTFSQNYLCDYADSDSITTFTDPLFKFHNNIIQIPNKVDWSTYDPVVVYAKAYILLENNMFNGSRYRDWDGLRYISRGTASPTTGNWVKGSIVYNTNVSDGVVFGWVCNTAGTPGTWSVIGQVGTGYRDYSGNPIGNTTPVFIGERVRDTTDNTIYISVGATNQDWKPITPESGRLGVKLTKVLSSGGSALTTAIVNIQTLSGSGYTVRGVIKFTPYNDLEMVWDINIDMNTNTITSSTLRTGGGTISGITFALGASVSGKTPLNMTIPAYNTGFLDVTLSGRNNTLYKA